MDSQKAWTRRLSWHKYRSSKCPFVVVQLVIRRLEWLLDRHIPTFSEQLLVDLSSSLDRNASKHPLQLSAESSGFANKSGKIWSWLVCAFVLSIVLEWLHQHSNSGSVSDQWTSSPDVHFAVCWKMRTVVSRISTPFHFEEAGYVDDFWRTYDGKLKKKKTF